MQKVDIHVHTQYSDGRASPQELLEEAARRQIKTIAITDHETTEGYRSGVLHAAHLGVELIPAMEVTCYWDGYAGHGGGPDIDVLAYFLDVESQALWKAEARLVEGLKSRAEAVCRTLRKQGLSIYLDDVLETHPTFPGFSPILWTMHRLELLESGPEMYSLLREAYFLAGRPIMSIDETIAMIHDAGGVAVLAHPSIIHREDDHEPLTERGMAELVEMGLDGVEVFHYRLNRMQRRHFANLARMFKLPISGGSDDHGWPDGFPNLGIEPVTPDMVDQLRVLGTPVPNPEDLKDTDDDALSLDETVEALAD